jgi:hypothetical protein
MLKNLLGKGANDREISAELREAIDEMQKERARYEALLSRASASGERLEQLQGPISRPASIWIRSRRGCGTSSATPSSVDERAVSSSKHRRHPRRCAQ